MLLGEFWEFWTQDIPISLTACDVRPVSNHRLYELPLVDIIGEVTLRFLPGPAIKGLESLQ